MQESPQRPFSLPFPLNESVEKAVNTNKRRSKLLIIQQNLAEHTSIQDQEEIDDMDEDDEDLDNEDEDAEDIEFPLRFKSSLSTFVNRRDSLDVLSQPTDIGNKLAKLRRRKKDKTDSRYRNTIQPSFSMNENEHNMHV